MEKTLIRTNLDTECSRECTWKGSRRGRSVKRQPSLLLVVVVATWCFQFERVGVVECFGTKGHFMRRWRENSSTDIRLKERNRFAQSLFFQRFNKGAYRGNHVVYSEPSDANDEAQSNSTASVETIPLASSIYETMESKENEGCSEGTSKELQSTKKFNTGRTVIVIGAVGLIVLSLLGMSHALPSPFLITADLQTSTVPYNSQLLLRDLFATVLSSVLAYGLLKSISIAIQHYAEPSAPNTNESTKPRKLLDTKDSRKLIHTLSAPLFIIAWPLFSSAEGSHWFTALVSAINGLRLYLTAQREISLYAPGESTSSLVRSVSRSGNAEEALQGPLIYVVILTATILAWGRNSPISICALATMAAGDGLADLIGRRWGRTNPWPKFLAGENKKSVAGSLAFVVGASVVMTGLLFWMEIVCKVPMSPPVFLAPELSWTAVVFRTVAIATTSAFIELLPIADDNYTVPISAAIMAYFLFGATF